MAVYTTLSDAELARFLGQYDLGEPTSLKGIAEGVENSNFFLATERGRYILTIFEKRVRADDLPFFMGLTTKLADAGVAAPRPIPTKTGELITQVKGKPAAIITFLDGVWPREPDIAHCAAIGEALARMHVALHGFELSRANALGPEGWSALIAPRLALAEFLRAGLAKKIEADMAEVRSQWPKDLPRGVIHADLFPDNALFLGDQLSGIIDFYFACTDFLAYDLAVCLNAWCFEEDGRYDLGRGGAMIAAYETIRPLTEAERAALPILCRSAALRFFATRLADWSETPEGAMVRPKNPLEYADKLAFHRKAKDAGDYGG
ncbi:MAG TPA: homoserine kinase [Terricaulis sp.]|nr:homoserine kinase [Terricaulis sp.]